MRKEFFRFAAVLLAVCIPLLPAVHAEARTAPPDFVELAKNLKPAVVNISTTKVVGRQQPSRRQQANPFGNDMFEDFFERDFQGRAQEALQTEGTRLGIQHWRRLHLHQQPRGRGSDEIKVKLSDGREFKGQIKGTDEKLDLALIMIDTKGNPSRCALGDSDALKWGSG